MLEEKIAKVKTLIAKREEIDAELAVLLGGEAPQTQTKKRKCSTCGVEGHQANACPQRSEAPANGAA